MSSPDWMNFGDEGDTTAAPPSSPDTFMFNANGDAHTSHPLPHPLHNHSHGSASKNSEVDIPLFLREDTAALHGAGAGVGNAASTPAFLSGMADPKEHDASVVDPSIVNAADTVARRPGTAGVDNNDSRSNVMYADQPSAALLHFNGDSGMSWSLHRVRILGKGNYGCATLYSMDEEITSGSPNQLPARRAVVVKDINVQTMLNPQEDMPAVQNELRVLRSAVGHPNLVQYVDALFDSRPASYPMCFILMEYAAGGDLAALLERGESCSNAGAVTAAAMKAGGAVRRLSSSALSTSSNTNSNSNMLPEDLIAAYLIQTAVGLHSLHTEHGILHRDVKPHNIFLLEDGVTVRLGDFGISMQLGRIGEKAKEACGSPYFMAPEVFEEKPYDSAADVWSLGVVFYQLLSHQLPFTASSVAALGALVRRGQFDRLSDSASSLSTSAAASKAAVYSKELRELVDSLLTVEVAARPTLRRVLRSRYVREHLHCVPISVLQAKKPLLDRISRSPLSSNGATTAAVAAPRFAEESLYASVFGAEAVAEAVARATHPGVTPIVNRISRS